MMSDTEQKNAQKRPVPVPDMRKLLVEKFGWSEFKTGQEEIVSILMAGHSALAVFPTGGGKSLCYQLPAIALDGLTVVVSPLIALMKDQIDQLIQKGIEAVRLDSSLTTDEFRTAMTKLRNGTAKLLYVAPERFFNERFRSSLDGIKISLFAIDEAHCISQWGHNFRPDYLKLAQIAHELKVERVLALTATATPDVQQDIRDAFFMSEGHTVGTSFYRPNLQLRTQSYSGEQRMAGLLEKTDSSGTWCDDCLCDFAKDCRRSCDELPGGWNYRASLPRRYGVGQSSRDPRLVYGRTRSNCCGNDRVWNGHRQIRHSIHLSFQSTKIA